MDRAGVALKLKNMGEHLQVALQVEVMLIIRQYSGKVGDELFGWESNYLWYPYLCF